MSNGPVLILGARSDIALATAHSYAALGHPIQLAARNSESLITAKEDLEIRYQVQVTLHDFDVLNLGHRPRDRKTQERDLFETHLGAGHDRDTLHSRTIVKKMCI